MPWPGHETTPTMARDQIMIVNLSGRGDKDAETIIECMKEKN
jgi:tryptophan synthase beta subunit